MRSTGRILRIAIERIGFIGYTITGVASRKLGELYRTLALRTVPLALAAGGITAQRAAQIRALLEHHRARR